MLGGRAARNAHGGSVGHGCVFCQKPSDGWRVSCALQGVPEDLLFFYDHLRKGGGVVRVDQSLLLYRYLPDAATHSVLEYVGPGAPGMVWGPRRAWAADAGPRGQVSRTRREIWAQGRARRAEPSWGAGAPRTEAAGLSAFLWRENPQGAVPWKSCSLLPAGDGGPEVCQARV